MSTSGDDLAEEQLFAESQASASKASQQLGNLAVKSASLLNAHRRTNDPSVPSSSPSRTKHTLERSSSVGMGRKGGAGKLSRPSWSRDDQAARKVFARRGDPYEFPASPEKGPFKLPEVVNHKHLKRVKKRVPNDVLLEAEEPAQPAEIPIVHAPENEAQPESSPPLTFDSPLDDMVEMQPQTDRQPAGETAEVVQVDFAEIPDSQPHTRKQPKRKAAMQLPRRQRSANTSRRDEVDVAEQAVKQTVPSRRTAQKPQPIRAHPQVVIPAQDKPRRKTGAKTRSKATSSHEEEEPIHLQDENADTGEHAEAGNQQELEQPFEQAHKEDPAPEPKQHKRGRSTRSKATKRTDRTPAVSNQETNVPEPTGPVRQTRSKAKSAPSSLVVRSKPVRAKDVSQASLSDNENLDDQDLIEELSEGQDEDMPGIGSEIADPAEGNLDHNGPDEQRVDSDEDYEEYPDIDKVFKYLDTGERSGSCQTSDAEDIIRACAVARELVLDPDVTLQDVFDACRGIKDTLAEYGADSDEEQLRALKIDAYGYVIRHIVRYLEVLYDWLKQQYGDLTKSLDAMRILSPFLREIVSFRDMIASWKIKLTSRYKNDRFVRDVEYQVIAPLRKVSEAYCAILRGLKEAAQKKYAHEEAERKQREKVEAARRQQELEADKTKRLNRWVDLHVCRLQAEPDICRRELLSFRQDYFDSQMDSLEERDANGDAFERVDVFRKRDSPPARHSYFGVDKDWTDEQLSALIDGLNKFAGPYVFHDIFQKYCRPKGPLRQFGVPEITARAAYIKSQSLKRYEEQGWEVPQWIKKIPVWP